MAGKLTDLAKLRTDPATQTTMSLRWVAERLRMGSRGYLAWLLRQSPQTGDGPEGRLQI